MTFQEIQKVCQDNNITNCAEYKKVRKNLNLPQMNLSITLGDEWKKNGKWVGLFGVDNRKTKGLTVDNYPTYEQAQIINIKNKVNGYDDYMCIYKELGLPAKPHEIYRKHWKIASPWNDYLGNKKQIKKDFQMKKINLNGFKIRFSVVDGESFYFINDINNALRKTTTNFKTNYIPRLKKYLYIAKGKEKYFLNWDGVKKYVNMIKPNMCKNLNHNYVEFIKNQKDEPIKSNINIKENKIQKTIHKEKPIVKQEYENNIVNSFINGLTSEMNKDNEQYVVSISNNNIFLIPTEVFNNNIDKFIK